MNKKRKSLNDQYPNEGTVNHGTPREMNEDNFFMNHSKESIAKKYMQFTVHMEALNETLELDNNVTLEIFALRVRDLIYAANTVRS